VLENVLSTINHFLAQDPKTREIYFKAECLKKVSLIFDKHPIPPIKKQTLLFCRNITQPKPLPHWKHVKQLIPILEEAIKGITNEETLSQALECVAAISEKEENIQKIIDSDFVPFLIQHAYNPKQDIFFSALRALGNIITGNEEQTNKILKHPTSWSGFLNSL